MTSRALCIIPARGGSKRIPRKNIIDFFGRPIISYSIQAAFDSGLFDTVMVSTDDEEIADVSRKYGAEVPFFRKPENSNDQAGLAEVILEVLNSYQNLGIKFDYVACVLATAPLIQYNNLVKAFNILQNSDADAVFPIEAFSYPPQRCLVMKNNKLFMRHPECYYARSQDLEKYYHDCGQFFFYKTSAILKEKKLYTKNSSPIILDEVESQDIDNYTDLQIAELKYTILKKRGLIC